MSMTIDVGDDSDELDDDLDLASGHADNDDNDEPGSSGRDSSRRKRASAADTDDEDDDEQTPEELRAEVKRLRASLSKANSSGQRRRQQLKDLRKKAAELEDREDEDAEPDEDDDAEAEKPKQRARPVLDDRQVKRTVDRAVKKRERELEQERTNDLIDMRIESKLAAAGVDEKSIRLLKREIDMDELDVDLKARRVEGMDDEIDRLKGEFPNLFRGSKGARRRINGGDDRDAGARAKGRTKTASEIQAERIRGH